MTPVTPMTPVTLSFLTTQQHGSVKEHYTPRSRGLAADLHSWLSPLISSGDEPQQLASARRPPTRLPELAEADEGPSSGSSSGADPLNSSQVLAEGTLGTLLEEVLESTERKFDASRSGCGDLHTTLRELAKECDGSLKGAVAKAMPDVGLILKLVKKHIKKVDAAVAADVESWRSGYEAALQHLRSFGVEHLQAHWAEADTARSLRCETASKQQRAMLERSRESEGGAVEAANKARAAEGAAAKAAAALEAEVAALKEELARERTRSEAAESALVKRFDQMDDITEQCTQSSRRLLAKVEWLTACWRLERKKSTGLEIELRKLKAQSQPGGRWAAEPEPEPELEAAGASEFEEKISGMRSEVEVVRRRMLELREHQQEIRETIATIRRDADASRARREAGAPPVSEEAATELVPTPPQQKQEGSGRRRKSGRKAVQLSVAIPAGSPATARASCGSAEKHSSGRAEKHSSARAERGQQGRATAWGSARHCRGQNLLTSTRRPALSMAASRLCAV